MTNSKNSASGKKGKRTRLTGEGDPFDSGEAQTPAADYDRNRSGLYGGRPEVRGYDKSQEKSKPGIS